MPAVAMMTMSPTTRGELAKPQPGTGTAIRLPQPGGIAVSPHRLARGPVVAGHDLIVAALFLGVEEIAADREGRPAWSDRLAPQRDRRRLGPVRLDPHAANDAVA